MDTITPEYETIEIETPGRRRKITKFALAGVAVLGVGAALTSAAWTDNVWFGGSATTGDLDLQGRANPGDTWSEGSESIPIVIPAIANVGPNQTDSHTVYVRNSGTVDVYLDIINVEGSGPLFGSGGATTLVSNVSDTDRILPPGAETTITVSVTGGNWGEDDFTTSSGSLEVHVHGTSDIPPAP